MIETKEAIRKARPRFVRSGATHIKRVSRSGYRKPKGLHNKVGDNKKGRRTTIKTGFGYPKALRGTTRKGLELVNISTLAEAKSLDASKQVAIVKSSLGMKNKKAILEHLASSNVAVQGIADIKTYLEKFDKKKQAQKKAIEDKNAAREKRKADAEAAKKGKQAKDDKKSEAKSEEADVKKEAKKEQDKVLTSGKE